MQYFAKSIHQEKMNMCIVNAAQGKLKSNQDF